MTQSLAVGTGMVCLSFPGSWSSSLVDVLHLLMKAGLIILPAIRHFLSPHNDSLLTSPPMYLSRAIGLRILLWDEWLISGLCETLNGGIERFSSGLRLSLEPQFIRILCRISSWMWRQGYWHRSGGGGRGFGSVRSSWVFINL